jgi:hypothetical protein
VASDDENNGVDTTAKELHSELVSWWWQLEKGKNP